MEENIKIISNNKKAYHDYFILEKYEAGICLTGTEVKSLRQGSCNLKDSWVQIRQGEAYLLGVHISPYEKGNIFNRDPMRERKLLLHKEEIRKLYSKVMEDGVSLIPVSVYFKGSNAKAEIALCRGKKLYDKRESDAKRTAQRDIERTLRQKY